MIMDSYTITVVNQPARARCSPRRAAELIGRPRLRSPPSTSNPTLVGRPGLAMKPEKRMGYEISL